MSDLNMNAKSDSNAATRLIRKSATYLRLSAGHRDKTTCRKADQCDAPSPAPLTDTDTRSAPQIRHDEIAASTTELETNQSDDEGGAVDGNVEDSPEVRVLDDADSEHKPRRKPTSAVRLASALGVVLVLALAGLSGWLGWRAYQSNQVQQQRELFVQVARQGALNLTTIDWQHADADMQRILNSATGTFYDDFSERSQPFVGVVKQAQSKSVGTIVEAGFESVSGDGAQVLVAVTVQTSIMAAPQQDSRCWRMRITVQKVGNEAKVSNVAFVP
jgi:Mce-associated membrane protein